VEVIDGKARGIICRNLITGELERHFGHAVLLCTGGYGNVFYLSTNAMGCNVTAAWKAHKKELILLIHVLHKFILHVFRSQEIIRAN